MDSQFGDSVPHQSDNQSAAKLCPLCESACPGGLCILSRCQHLFHAACIGAHLRRFGHCPLASCERIADEWDVRPVVVELPQPQPMISSGKSAGEQATRYAYAPAELEQSSIGTGVMVSSTAPLSSQRHQFEMAQILGNSSSTPAQRQRERADTIYQPPELPYDLGRPYIPGSATLPPHEFDGYTVNNFPFSAGTSFNAAGGGDRGYNGDRERRPAARRSIPLSARERELAATKPLSALKGKVKKEERKRRYQEMKRVKREEEEQRMMRVAQEEAMRMMEKANY